MALFSIEFTAFVLLFLVLNELVGKYCSGRQWYVRLAASICFYVLLAKIRIVFLLISALSVWCAAMLMEHISVRSKEQRKAEGLTRDDKKAIKKHSQNQKKAILWVVIALNLGILALVKYLAPSMSSSIILPLGISFYTFQAIAYIVDIYGDKYGAQSSFAKFLLYVSWFPQLIQGPINRYDQINRDLYEDTRLSWDAWKLAMLLFMFGAIKRYAVGDTLEPAVNAILGADTITGSGSYLLFGAFLYAIEQYANFSGGIDMVMAVSMLFGVKMSENFRQPYFSKNLAEFWRRWHITLGSWMRDYVFYPFAVMKSVQKMTAKITEKWGKHWGRTITGGIGNLLVFALVGIWHGPQLHFLAWGLYNGVIIALSDAMSPVFDKFKSIMCINDNSKGFKAFQIFRTFMIIVFAGYFDIVRSVSIGINCFRSTIFDFRIRSLPAEVTALFEDGILSAKSVSISIIGIVILVICSIYKEHGIAPESVLYRKPIVLRWGIIYFMLFFLLFSFSALTGDGGFMYAAF